MTARRAAALLATVAALGLSLVYLVRLAASHTSGAEMYGVLVALVAVGTGIATLALILRRPMNRVPMIVVLALWALVAIAGVAGVAAHIIGPVAGHGPVDDRARPVAAPLIFTLVGLVGATAVYIGRGTRHESRRHASQISEWR
jgi:hypothetical protein